MTQPLFQAWPGLAATVAAAPRVLLLCDYDGTLTPIASRPADAILPETMRRKLAALATSAKYITGILSGRPLAELKELVGLDGIYYAGNHGFEIQGPGLRFTHPQAAAARPVLMEIAPQLAARTKDVGGVIIEDKGLSLSLHYRLVASRQQERLSAIFAEITAPYAARKQVRITHGKKVWEIRPPVDWDKGKALAAIRERVDAPLTIYLGDDTTDEDAFRMLQPPQGWGIYIGGENHDSAATYHLEDTGEVGRLLQRLIAVS